MGYGSTLIHGVGTMLRTSLCCAVMNSPVNEQFMKQLAIGNLQLTRNTPFPALRLIANLPFVYCLLPIVYCPEWLFSRLETVGFSGIFNCNRRKRFQI